MSRDKTKVVVYVVVIVYNRHERQSLSISLRIRHYVVSSYLFNLLFKYILVDTLIRSRIRCNCQSISIRTSCTSK